jgi:hypothetical protein
LDLVRGRRLQGQKRSGDVKKKGYRKVGKALCGSCSEENLAEIDFEMVGNATINTVSSNNSILLLMPYFARISTWIEVHRVTVAPTYSKCITAL